jgi:hypothetical protein
MESLNDERNRLLADEKASVKKGVGEKAEYSSILNLSAAAECLQAYKGIHHQYWECAASNT